MKKTILISIALSTCLTACVSVKDVGQLTMVANRNIETSQKYQQIQKYATLDKKEMKKTRASSIQAAVDEVVKKVDGGEYLMNVKIYQIMHSRYGQQPAMYYAVEGDVWGIKPK
mgnify:CR=1 FL=1